MLMKGNSIKGSLDRRLFQEENRREKRKKERNVIMQKLILVLLLGGAFIAVKIVGGIYSHSLAVISDAVHMFTDFFAFFIAVISVWISDFPANNLHSFGYHRAGIIGALTSIILVWVLNCFLVYYAVERMMDLNLVNIHAKLMFYISCFGLVVNIAMIYILRSRSCFGEGTCRNLCKKRRKRSKNDNTREFGPEFPFNESSTNPLLESTQDRQNINQVSISEDQEELNKNFKSEIFHTNINPKGNISEQEIYDIPNESQRETEKVDRNESIKECDQIKDMAMHEKENNIIVRATMLHILTDIFQSLIIIIGSLLIWQFPDKAKIVDPILTFIFTFIVFIPSISIAIECCSVLMEGSPLGFDINQFEEQIKAVDEVCEVHDLHVWSPDIGRKAMSVHIFTNSCRRGYVLRKVTEICRAYGIYHSTIQIETTQDKEHQNYIDCEHQMH